jgi:hypothetical protein
MPHRKGKDLLQFELGRGTNVEKGNAVSYNVRYSII